MSPTVCYLPNGGNFTREGRHAYAEHDTAGSTQQTQKWTARQQLVRGIRLLLVVASPLVIWYVGNVLATIFQLPDLAELANPRVLSPILLPRAVAVKSIPLWVDIALATSMSVLFIACVVIDLNKSVEVIRTIYHWVIIERSRVPQFLLPLVILIATVTSLTTVITLSLRPARANM